MAEQALQQESARRPAPPSDSVRRPWRNATTVAASARARAIVTSAPTPCAVIHPLNRRRVGRAHGDRTRVLELRPVRPRDAAARGRLRSAPRSPRPCWEARQPSLSPSGSPPMAVDRGVDLRPVVNGAGPARSHRRPRARLLRRPRRVLEAVDTVGGISRTVRSYPSGPRSHPPRRHHLRRSLPVGRVRGRPSRFKPCRCVACRCRFPCWPRRGCGSRDARRG